MNRKPNLDILIVAGIEKEIGISFVPEKENGEIPASAGMTSLGKVYINQEKKH